MSSRVIEAGILAVGVALAGWFAGRGLYEARASDRFVTVKGVAERAVEADVAVWPLTIVVSDDDLTPAHEQLARNVAATNGFLRNNGVPADDVSSQGFSVTDNESNRFGSSAPANRYTINQTLVVRSDDPKTVLAASANVPDLVAAGVVLQSGGPYQSAGPSFLFTRLNELKPDMIAEATARAREAAAKFAQDSGARVGGIRRANQGVFQILARDQVASINEQHQLHKVVRVVSTIEYFLDE
jgi:hypothetical protein